MELRTWWLCNIQLGVFVAEWYEFVHTHQSGGYVAAEDWKIRVDAVTDGQHTHQTQELDRTPTNIWIYTYNVPFMNKAEHNTHHNRTVQRYTESTASARVSSYEFRFCGRLNRFMEMRSVQPVGRNTQFCMITHIKLSNWGEENTKQIIVMCGTRLFQTSLHTIYNHLSIHWDSSNKYTCYRTIKYVPFTDQNIKV